eukprot:14025590-Alexandrium_andersonii.AAC.1
MGQLSTLLTDMNRQVAFSSAQRRQRTTALKTTPEPPTAPNSARECPTALNSAQQLSTRLNCAQP